jgi:acetylornithine deacetylase/succinyl-diaminopimelate desuccinylase-like protein
MKPVPAVELLQELVRIPSVNPDGNPGVDAPGEAALADYLKTFLEGLGADVELREVLPGRPNVVARFPSNRPGKPRLLLAPHTDTVSVLGMTIDPFLGEVRDGKVWGRGASDTKGPMAAMLAALQELAGRPGDLTHEIWFAGLMGEEAGLVGSSALAVQEDFDFVIVGEPTGMKAVYAHKGASWLTLTTHGRSAHASTPEAGENAIDSAMTVLLALKAAFAIESEKISDPVLGKSTMSLGILCGGSKVNIVPDHCEAGIDMRIVPGFDVEGFLAGFAEAHPRAFLKSKTSAPLFTDPAHPLIKSLEKLGIPTATAPWFCDAASFGQKGIPAIALGPGSIAQAHTADEWIAIADLDAGVTAFQTFLHSLRE